ADVVSDAMLYLPFALVFDPLWVGAVIVLAGLGEFTGVLGSTLGAGRRYEGPMGKSDRAFVFGALGLWIAAVPAAPPGAAWLMPAIAALTALTALRRGRAALQAPAAALPCSAVPTPASKECPP